MDMRHFLVVVFCLVGLTLLSLPAEVHGQVDNSSKVIDVRVEGNNQMSSTAVLVNVRTRIGSDYNKSTVQADEKRLK